MMMIFIRLSNIKSGVHLPKTTSYWVKPIKRPKGMVRTCIWSTQWSEATSSVELLRWWVIYSLSSHSDSGGKRTSISEASRSNGFMWKILMTECSIISNNKMIFLLVDLETVLRLIYQLVIKSSVFSIIIGTMSTYSRVLLIWIKEKISKCYRERMMWRLQVSLKSWLNFIKRILSLSNKRRKGLLRMEMGYWIILIILRRREERMEINRILRRSLLSKIKTDKQDIEQNLIKGEGIRLMNILINQTAMLMLWSIKVSLKKRFRNRMIINRDHWND